VSPDGAQVLAAPGGRLKGAARGRPPWSTRAPAASPGASTPARVPTHAVWSSEGYRIFVADAGAKRLLVISPFSGLTLRRLALGATPTDLADPARRRAGRRAPRRARTSLTGSRGPDRILGLGGDDDLRGGRGDDEVFGGAGPTA
jgi:hypothetical protein